MKKVREGYKMTELGEIPEEWEVRKLIDVADKSDKYSFTGGPFGSNLKSCHYTEKGVRVIQLQNIGDGKFINNYFIYTSDAKADELMSCNIYPGDIIIAKMAEPVARSCKIPEYETRYLMCSDGIRLAIDKKNSDVNYITYSINSEYFRSNAIANSTGTTRLRIGLSELKNLPIIIPSLKEQQKIASILSSVDEQIEITDNLIEKTKELKKGLMQRLLTKGIGHNRFKDTELGIIPEEWEVKKFQNLYSENIRDFGSFSTTKLIEYVDGGIPYLRSENFKENRLLIDSISYITKDVDKLLNKSYVYKGNILFTKIGNIGCACVYNGQLGERCNSNATIAKIKVDNTTLDKEYIAYFLNSALCKKQYAGSIISTPPRINMGEINNFKIAIPSLNEQKQISSILSSIDNQISQYQSKKEKLQELKKGLMQKLLTGKIRVKV